MKLAIKFIFDFKSYTKNFKNPFKVLVFKNNNKVLFMQRPI